MFVLVWNSQGIASKQSQRFLHNLCSQYKPLLLVVKKKVNGHHANLILANMHYSDWVCIESASMSGGIWLFWNCSNTSVSVLKMHSQFLYVIVDDQLHLSWFFTAIYGSPRKQLRLSLYTTLHELASCIFGPWLLSGDFNDYVDPSETSSSGIHIVARCTHLRQWMSNLRLLDLLVSGPKFTWHRDCISGFFKAARLDCSIYTIVWYHLLSFCYNFSSGKALFRLLSLINTTLHDFSSWYDP
ncbi:hypothetical protein MANES_07G034350v8 [Manihot esculenta]|uniref:Uncharacterized protein n=1 Tax=Manihot esculenta TaxID=3983 RepID=A0ACB7HEX6_MANES|nr:hypothetical protein MANES_07G034350v8 [Manihot esculenta]